MVLLNGPNQQNVSSKGEQMFEFNKPDIIVFFNPFSVYLNDNSDSIMRNICQTQEYTGKMA